MKASWLFEQTPPMGGATGEAFANTLLGTGMSPDGVLAREAIQNSCDAANDPDKEKVRIVFRRITLKGDEKKRFVAQLGLDGEIHKRKEHLDLPPGNCLEKITDADKPLHLLFIEDYQTHGLYGDPHDDSSHFFRLLLSLGDGSKARDEKGSGGSYGYGKSVYSANSRLRTIVAYSVFTKDVKDGGSLARLMGCSYYRAHKAFGSSFSGRAWFGLNSSPVMVDPLEGDLANELAENIGFKVRRATETGTSILIVDCEVDTEQLRESIEQWWWPRLIEDSLDVEIYEQSSRVAPPRPRSRTDLKPFIECFDLATGRVKPRTKSEKANELYKLQGISLGSFGFQVLSDSLVDDKLDEKKNCVALIRSPKMVVSYLDVGTCSIPVVGVFLANSEIDFFLKLSEPASHDRWDPTSSRLAHRYEHAREFVKAVVDRIKRQMKNFANEALPPVPKAEIRPKMLEKLLGSLFRPPSKGGFGEPGPVDPVSIRFVRQPHIKPDGDLLKTAGSFKVGLKPEYEKESAEVILDLRCNIVEDDGVSSDDSIRVFVKCDDVDYEVLDENPFKIKFPLDKTIPASIDFETDSYNRDWTTQIKVVVTRGEEK